MRIKLKLPAKSASSPLPESTKGGSDQSNWSHKKTTDTPPQLRNNRAAAPTSDAAAIGEKENNMWFNFIWILFEIEWRKLSDISIHSSLARQIEVREAIDQSMQRVCLFYEVDRVVHLARSFARVNLTCSQRVRQDECGDGGAVCKNWWPCEVVFSISDCPIKNCLADSLASLLYLLFMPVLSPPSFFHLSFVSWLPGGRVGSPSLSSGTRRRLEVSGRRASVCDGLK